MAATANIYPFSSCSFGSKEQEVVKDCSLDDRINHMKLQYQQEGMRRSVEGILLVHEHNYPQVLLFQMGGGPYHKLPGGRHKTWRVCDRMLYNLYIFFGGNRVAEIEGLKRKLTSKLGARNPDFVPDWEIGERVAVWWRPNFEAFMYPYCPPNITKPKECKKLFLVHLSEKEYFEVPKNLKLLPVPLFELHHNVQSYGSVTSTIPQLLSRFKFNMITQ